MGEKYQRDFKGVWITKEIWLNRELSVMEKLFLVEIDSLDNEQGCFASNKHFSDFFDISKGRCTQIIKSLEEKGLVSINYEYKGKQIIKRTIRVVNKLNRVVNKLNGGSKNTKQGYLENDEDNNTLINNTINNTSNKTTEPAKADSGDKSPVDDLKDKFESLWSNYPKKTGKKNAFRHYKRAIKDGTKDDEIAQGIDNYLKRITIERIKPQYIKGGSAWFNGEHWNDEVQTHLDTTITYQAPAVPIIKEYVQTDAEREEAEKLLAERQARRGDS